MSGADLDGALPGAELVSEGLRDLAKNRLTEAALVVLIAAPRLRRLSIPVPEMPQSRPWGHELYEQLERRLGTAAHSHYNSLLRRIVSFARARERESSGQDQTPP
jgi:hypothetical protein